MSSNETGSDVGAKSAAPEAKPDAAKTETPIIESQWKLSPEARNSAIHDQVNHSLFIDSVPSNFRPNLNVNKYGPQQTELDLSHPIIRSGPQDPISQKRLMEDEARRAQRDSEILGPYRNTPGHRKSDIYTESRQRFSDRAADMIFPGFGRVESKDPNNQWRLDYLYSSRCHVKGLGMCFSMKMK